MKHGSKAIVYRTQNGSHLGVWISFLPCFLIKKAQWPFLKTRVLKAHSHTKRKRVLKQWLPLLLLPSSILVWGIFFLTSLCFISYLVFNIYGIDFFSKKAISTSPSIQWPLSFIWSVTSNIKNINQTKLRENLIKIPQTYYKQLD